MKKQFEIPVVNIKKFHTERILTTSGVDTNLTEMQKMMGTAGYKVTVQSLAEFQF